jgi:hypothetical protein
MAKLRCAVCNQGPAQGVALFPTHEPGHPLREWRCEAHMEPTQHVDAEVRELVDFIEQGGEG